MNANRTHCGSLWGPKHRVLSSVSRHWLAQQCEGLALDRNYPPNPCGPRTAILVTTLLVTPTSHFDWKGAESRSWNALNRYALPFLIHHPGSLWTRSCIPPRITPFPAPPLTPAVTCFGQVCIRLCSAMLAPRCRLSALSPQLPGTYGTQRNTWGCTAWTVYALVP